MHAAEDSLHNLLLRHSQVSELLRERRFCRTSNNPVGDIAEYLFSTTFGWQLETNSRAGFDARSAELGKVQIKGRRISKFNTSRQAGDIRNLDQKKFDWLAGVVFDSDWDVLMAVMLPHHMVLGKAIDIEHTNSSRIYLRDSLLELPEARDVTTELRKSWHLLRKRQIA